MPLLKTSLLTLIAIIALIGALPASAFAAADELLIADFESDSYSPWTVTGKAFGPGPAQGTLPGQMHVDGFRGRGLVNSFFEGDDSKGSLTSPEFTLQRHYISFLIGGGQNPEELAFQLLVDGKVVRSATGGNSSPGGSEALELQSWDVAEFSGLKARLQIIDNAAGSWGHINVDHVIQTNTRPRGFLRNAEQSYTATARYLHLPIRNDAPKRVVTLFANGQKIVRNDIGLADDQPDWWAPVDISAWRAQSLTLRVDKLHEDSKALQSVQQSDSLKDGDNLYREPLRGQFHFSPRRGWNNDPNGCVFYNGEYHLFFQHNPYGWSWGNMHWGHAVSKDLVHWQEIGDQLLPDDMGPMFSGSAVVDWKNTSGLGRDGKPPLVLFYTAAGNPTVQCMAWSTDGRSFTKYSGNPIVTQVTGGNRDPKVIWHAPTQRWVMTLYVEWQQQHTVHFFTSQNLREWTLASISRGDAPGGGFLYECPDFFELPVDGDASRTKWALLGANSAYALGSFDGKRFLPDVTRLPGHRGRGFYAAQSFSDVPDGRRILIGWWQTETKGMPFNQSMSLPLELRLTQTDDGPRMTFTPVKELETLRAKSNRLGPLRLQPGDPNPLAELQAELAEVRAEFEPGAAKRVVFNIRGTAVEYDTVRQEISAAGLVSPAPLRDGRQRLIIYCDRTGLEIFASDGLCYMPLPMNLRPEDVHLNLEARDGVARIHSLEIHELRSAWTRKQ
jgi:sucrose-6-phosphate hydrolase SacC (GH32 family)